MCVEPGFIKSSEQKISFASTDAVKVRQERSEL